MRQKSYQAKCNAQAAFKFSGFFEKAFVSHANRRSCIVIVRFCCSTCGLESEHYSRVPCDWCRQGIDALACLDCLHQTRVPS